MEYVIVDWANNVLCSFQNKLWIEMEFESFESGWDYIYENFEEIDFEDFYVVNKKEVGE